MRELKRVTIGKVDLVAVLGDITDEQSDVIVNAAGSRLAHGGGVAAAILTKGGEQIAKESHRWISEHGNVPVGQIAITSAGNLCARYVIHAVGPIWGEGNEEIKLRNAVRNSIKKVMELKLSSVSLPAISTGIYGYPKEEGVRIIIDEIISTIDKPETLKEVRFCAIDSYTANLFKKELENASK
jgi:O-acetyl-ADP-ribose deacetylase (regulator of RNase III)